MNTQINASYNPTDNIDLKASFEMSYQFTHSWEFRRNGWKNIILVKIGYFLNSHGKKQEYIVPFNIHTKLDIYDKWTVKKCRKRVEEDFGKKLYPCYEIIPVE